MVDHEVLVRILVVVLEVEALLLDKGGVLRRTVVVVEVLLRVVVVVEEQVLGVLVAKEHVRVVVVEVLKTLKCMVVVSEGGQDLGAVAAASVNSGDTREEEIWTVYRSDRSPIVDQLYDIVPTLKSISVCLNSLRVVYLKYKVHIEI